MIRMNWTELVRRGADLNNTDFRIYRCASCGRFALYDDEHMHLFPYAQDLTIGVLYGAGGSSCPCPSCRTPDSYEECDAQSMRRVIEDTEWSFLFV